MEIEIGRPNSRGRKKGEVERDVFEGYETVQRGQGTDGRMRRERLRE